MADETQRYRYRMADGVRICETGSIHAINLTTGYTVWQIVNPYGRLTRNEEAICDTAIYDNYIDWSWVNMSLCERATDGSDMLPANQTCQGECVIYPDIDVDNEPVEFMQDRGKFYGGITIANDMLFIPSLSGDVFVHNIIDGLYIDRFVCPNITTTNRPAVGGGVTVVGNRVVFYCGKQIQRRVTDNALLGNELISMQLSNG